MEFVQTFFLCFSCVLLSHGKSQSSLKNILRGKNNYNDYLLKDASYEIIFLPQQRQTFIDFDVFGREFHLNFKPNHNIVSKRFKAYLSNNKIQKEIENDLKTCYYLHVDDLRSAAMNICGNDTHILVFYENYVLEILPMKNVPLTDGNFSPFIVKKIAIDASNWHKEISHVRYPDLDEARNSVIAKNFSKINPALNIESPIIETALFFDEQAYKIFSPYFGYDVKKIRDMLLAYVNAVQALYHQPSLGTQIEIRLSRMEIFRTQPLDLETHDGERGMLLESFCSYSKAHNPEDDADPEHWDLALYISGLDFYAIEDGVRSGVTMGLAAVGGICQTKYACVIAEFGVTNIFGKPYPSAGFTSVFVLAHEIGHSLGMHHDGSTNGCPRDGFIMSPSRGVTGETLWSSCSAEVTSQLKTWARCLFDESETIYELDHSKFKDKPGVTWGAKKQCELLLKDTDADIFGDINEGICQSLRCKTPHRSGFYFAGPAIDGTFCGPSKWCLGGECVKVDEALLEQSIKGGWSKWKTEVCSSGCLQYSKGYQSRRRSCNNPVPKNSRSCIGTSFEVLLCEDYEICNYKRETSMEYASRKCGEFSELVQNLDAAGSGLQAPHESERLWMACTIFCKRSDANSYYSPRLELNDLHVNSYFPDGTWCHNDGIHNYYCLQHHCLPEDFYIHQKKKIISNGIEPLPQNAPPKISPLPDSLRKYLSLDSSGKPISTRLSPGSSKMLPENFWETNDYIEIPSEDDYNFIKA